MAQPETLGLDYIIVTVRDDVSNNRKLQTDELP